jgi:hypothetical protein
MRTLGAVFRSTYNKMFCLTRKLRGIFVYRWCFEQLTVILLLLTGCQNVPKLSTPEAEFLDIVYGNLKSENSQDYDPETPTKLRNCTLMNSACVKPALLLLVYHALASLYEMCEYKRGINYKKCLIFVFPSLFVSVLIQGFWIADYYSAINMLKWKIKSILKY